ncbi:MAG TPA: alcohol dehydrogenase catalytic domain-containing protein [Anaerolineaceae bacterium]
MTDPLTKYCRADTPLPKRQRVWPLYGAGFDHLGQDGAPIEAPVPEIGPGELLVRHDAVGLCFSDIKVIKAGQEHPRIYKNMQTDPVVLGHEVTLTVVKVGADLGSRYKPGDRFIVQADIFVGGVGYAYGYELQGGLSQYNKLDERVLAGDDGCYLIPVRPSTGYAESALTEPWACVTAAYELKYRSSLKPNGTTWILGGAGTPERAYTISAGFDESAHPARLLLSNVPAHFAGWLRQRCASLGVELIDAPDAANPPVDLVDDIVVLGADADLIERVSPHLAAHGILAILAEQPLPRKLNLDVGRIHYNRWVYVGGQGPDIARAYADLPVRSMLKPGGRAWFVGAGGPMGHMHVQRAIQVAGHPGTIVCTEMNQMRVDELCEAFAGEAAANGIEWVCLNALNREEYQAKMAEFREGGFDDIVVLAPVPAAINEAVDYLAPEGVMNIFAGLNRGAMAAIDLSGAYLKGERFIGQSASTIADLRFMLDQAESGKLSPNRSVAAVGSLGAARDGLRAVHDALFPGKVVIYPQIKDFPLTALSGLKEKLPSVWARLKDGRMWTVEAEQEFLRLMLPDLQNEP